MALCWGITDGSAGMAAQVRALAHALGLEPQMHGITLKKPWGRLPSVAFTGPFMRLIPLALSEKFAEPWPDVVISCGRRGAIAALGLRVRMGAHKAALIHIQDPYINPKYFDLIIAMEHDRISAENVIKTRFALHEISPARLEAARKEFAPRFAVLPGPYTAVLLGGSTNKYTLTLDVMAQLVMALKRVADTIPGSLLITPSRRTGEGNIAMLRATFAQHPRVYVYDGSEPNPYMGMLACADSIIVTDDSVNMMSEAHATGKPLYLLHLPGHDYTKPARFAQRLLDMGIARPMTPKLENWVYPAGDEMGELVAKVRQRLPLEG